MEPIVPHWKQPSHDDILEVIHGSNGSFDTKSISKITVAPYEVFARMTFPPCTTTTEPTYATVQMGPDTHLNLNSDLLYINHSCEPSLIFNVASLSIVAGPLGVSPGDELTYFYPSTEWNMSQAFDCACGTKSCLGRIDGAASMAEKDLASVWLNDFVRDMKLEQRAKPPTPPERPARNAEEVVTEAKKNT